MSTTTQSPELAIEQKLDQGRAKARACLAELKEQISDQPLKAVGVAVGIGYLARSLPLVAVTAATAKTGLRALPSALFALGAWKAWTLANRCRADGGSMGLCESRAEPGNGGQSI